MLKDRISKKYKVGDSVTLITGSKEYRGKVFVISKVSGDSVYLTGYKTRQRAQKITDKNTDNYKAVDIPVHLSNIVGATPDGKPSKIGFQIKDDKKVRILKKTKTAY
jgi:large subunit ribosomal protein L24